MEDPNDLLPPNLADSFEPPFLRSLQNLTAPADSITHDITVIADNFTIPEFATIANEFTAGIEKAISPLTAPERAAVIRELTEVKTNLETAEESNDIEVGNAALDRVKSTLSRFGDRAQNLWNDAMQKLNQPISPAETRITTMIKLSIALVKLILSYISQ